LELAWPLQFPFWAAISLMPDCLYLSYKNGSRGANKTEELKDCVPMIDGNTRVVVRVLSALVSIFFIVLVSYLILSSDS
jgi:hypothetical protein